MADDPFFAPYDETFWKENGSREHREAERKIGRVLFELTGRKGPVIDVGCGTGQMLRAIDEAGARPVLGIESEQGLAWCKKLGIQDLETSETVAVDLRGPIPDVLIDPDRSIYLDFTHTERNNYTLNRSETPNLVVCIEVLEHIPEDSAKNVVEQICRWNPEWIALSGAAPGSPGGTGHINEQQPLYWMNLVHSFGTHWFDALASDELHRRIWGTFTWSHLVNLYRRME